MNLNKFKDNFATTKEGQRYEALIRAKFDQYNDYVNTESAAKAKKKPVSYIIG